MADKKKKLGPGRHLSAIKRHRQDVKRSEQNRSARSELKTAMKKLLRAIEEANQETAQELFIKTQSLTDRAIKRGLIHTRTGHRHIARLHRRLAAMS